MEQLLRLLKANARQSTAELAAQLDCTDAEVNEKMARLESEGVIRGYQAIIDTARTDSRDVTAIITVKVVPQREDGFDHIAYRIARFPEVSSMHLMSGVADLMLFVEGADLGEVARFVSERLATIPGVSGTETHFMLKTYKNHGVIMGEEEKDERLKVTP